MQSHLMQHCGENVASPGADLPEHGERYAAVRQSAASHGAPIGFPPSLVVKV